MGQQLAHRRRSKTRLGRHQRIGAQVVVRGRVEIDEPLSHSCMTAIAVNVLVIEAIRKTVSWVTGLFDRMSATPCP